MKQSNTFHKLIYCFVFFSLILPHSSFAQIIDLDDAASKRTLALVIGISDYEYLDDLQYAHKDAEDFANFLKSDEGLNLPDENVVLFTNKQAKKNDLIFQGLDWLENELNEGDEAYIYFSGHGDITNKDVEDLIKTGYLLTYESRKPHLEITALRMDYFLERFHTIATTKKAVVRLVLDVCHAGFGLEKGVITLLEIDKNIDEEKQIIITSCNDNEYSWEYPALKNSCFSYFFMEGLKGAADENQDNNITLEELEEYSSKNVKRYVKAKSNNQSRQSPQFKGEYYHVMAHSKGQYTSKPVDYDKLAEGTGKGLKKGVARYSKKNEAKAENILEKTEDRSLTGKEIQDKFKNYQELPEETNEQQAAKRQKKRELVAAIVDNADKAIAAYFVKQNKIMADPYYAPASEYYLIAANLLGEGHFLYNDLLGKYFFIEALKMNTDGHSNAKDVITKLKTSLEFEPDASYTLNELGNVYLAKGEAEEALNYYEKANKISPDWAIPMENKIKANKAYPLVPKPYEVSIDNKLGANSKSAAFADANPETKEVNDLVYNIQLAASSKANPAEFKKVEDLGPITPEFNPERNLINTWLGPFETEKEAKLKLKKAKERGFKDAFLVKTQRDTSLQKKLDEKRVELKKEYAAAMPFQVRIASVGNYKEADFAKLTEIGNVEAEQVIVNGKTLFRVLIRSNYKKEADELLQKVKKAGFKDAYIFKNNSQTVKPHDSKFVPSSYEYSNTNPARYKIRVATVSKLVENQFSNVENLGHIYMDVVHDKGLIRVSLGDFPTKQKATVALNKIKKLGYKDAFIFD